MHNDDRQDLARSNLRRASGRVFYVLDGDGPQRLPCGPRKSGVQILRRTYEGKAEFLLISLWESYDAIRAFAGEDIERAVYYSKDKEFLLELEPKVTHYEYESHKE